MDTFNLLKAKYIEAKLQYLSNLELDYKCPHSNESDGSDADVNNKKGPYAVKRWESFNMLKQAAFLMSGYIAHCAMNAIQHPEYTCFFEGFNEIEDTRNPSFEFYFEFMAMPRLELLKKPHPRLIDIWNQIKFGSISVSEVNKVLDKAGIPHGDMYSLVDYSDNDLMRIPFDKLIHDLKVEGESEINEFTSTSKYY